MDLKSEFGYFESFYNGFENQKHHQVDLDSAGYVAAADAAHRLMESLTSSNFSSNDCISISIDFHERLEPIVGLIREEVSPMKLSNDDEDKLVGEKQAMTKMQQVKKFRPKVMTPKPITPSPSSSSSRGHTSVKSSCRRALDFDAQTKTMLIYTKGGHCFTRSVNKYMEGRLECNDKEEDMNEQEEELFRQRALSFITSMRHVQGNRGFMGWKGSVVDSVVGVFLTQNAPDNLSSSAFMCLAAKYLIEDPKEGISKHALDWNAVRCAQPYEISHVIQERGMNNRIAARIQVTFLDSIYNHKSGLLDDLEWLRKAKPEKTMEFFSKIYGLGIKSMDCLRLLTLRQHAFPVDRHVARIVVRLGWVPVEKLPDGVLIHELEEYPMMEAVQDYLSQRLSNLDVDTLYELHYQMITFGKVFCTKKKPNCNSCPLKKECKHFASAFGRFPPQGEFKTFVPRTPTPGQSSSRVQVILEEDIEDLCKVHPVIKVMKNAAGKGKEEEEVVVGRFLVPCRTATRGSFPLDGTFFQINEVFADDESCKKPVVVSRNLLSDLTIKTLFCGTSISAIFQVAAVSIDLVPLVTASHELRLCRLPRVAASHELRLCRLPRVAASQSAVSISPPSYYSFLLLLVPPSASFRLLPVGRSSLDNS
ncbi:DNA glycosylase [Cynara cardunculus var. scolymus]|uniref:DNA glycosylase n=1 Tax=Cynara cardunculus var. scolymus TaxID=59895 RepID=A0A103XUK2_CYNCS|nr:DNA glycosylase [Cynara cardunculus var. scolymus]